MSNSKRLYLQLIKDNKYDQLKDEMEEIKDRYNTATHDTNDLIQSACEYKHTECIRVLLQYNVRLTYPWDAIGSDFIDDSITCIFYFNRSEVIKYAIQVKNRNILDRAIRNKFWGLPSDILFKDLMDCKRLNASLTDVVIDSLRSFVSDNFQDEETWQNLINKCCR